jgi:hypothetical protein
MPQLHSDFVTDISHTIISFTYLEEIVLDLHLKRRLGEGHRLGKHGGGIGMPQNDAVLASLDRPPAQDRIVEREDRVAHVEQLLSARAPERRQVEVGVFIRVPSQAQVRHTTRLRGNRK